MTGRLEFKQKYQEYCYDLGKDITASNFKGVTVKVKDQENVIAIKIYDSELNEMAVKYDFIGASEYTLPLSDDSSATVRYIGIMSMAEGEDAYSYSVTVTDITADVEEKENENTNKNVLTFEGENLKFKERWGDTPVEGTRLHFESGWAEYYMSVGQELKGENIESINIYTTENTEEISFKLYSGEKDEENKPVQVAVVYGQKGKKVYNYEPDTTGKVTEFAIMSMGGDGKTFPFDVEVEKIEIVLDNSEKVAPEVETDIVDLRDPVTDLMGDDFIIGTAISYMEFADELEMELVTKHFNGVTLGNELKPDSMIKKDAQIKTVAINGEEIQFPELNYETPERYLDFFVNWNNEHSEKKIRIRGHVLVWHSQTPEFFFHEDYDESKPYVTPEVMNKRLEFYIKSVAEHFTAEGSKYRDLFYGWDVVNEAVSDGTGTYRSGNENSSWWRVYQSPEFIQNAFVYANRYMPSNIALFYNDYNETVSSKVSGICELLRTVKATPGARIDGMGMQAHYQIDSNNPSMEQIKKAAKQYSEIVDQVQLTELDFKGSRNSTDERLAQRYKDVYDTVRRLKNEGVNITGMTIWGVVDKHSWLQTANNNGGGADGSSKQYPLLFDNNYKAFMYL